ncbi:hypothetical protein PanWU01x14_298290 [Parasponia andersonii]|uniref:Uncharacterized protein n=1 Tax=Parasponia andersonii TaxID=3476 RepID=A0A2P5AUW6_PARAD|nr:hypothetical protein PanWU01x14_298290 [Parasponia andersonii]
MDTYVPRVSKHLRTTDLRERLNQRRREAQVYHFPPQQGREPVPQMRPALEIALVGPVVPEQQIRDGDEHYQALKRQVDQLLAEQKLTKNV